ncbi:MAG: polysaccharide deacetylase family protein [Brevinematales bacterium]
MLGLCLGTASGFSQDYETGTWPDFKDAAVCFTFDDGCPNQYKTAIPMFDEYGFKLTMFTVTGWSPDWEKLKKASLNGHEIASHTVNHSSLGFLPAGMQDSELSNSQNEINKHIPDKKCLTLAYPNCIKGNYDICGKYYIAARGCGGVIESSTPSDFMDISSIVCGVQGTVKTGGDFISKTDSALSSGGLCVFLIHALDGDSGYSTLLSGELRKELEYLKSINGRVWVATFRDIVLYIRERNSITVIETSTLNNMITLKVSDGLDDSVYNYPVTLRRKLRPGENFKNASAVQNGKEVKSSIVNTGSSVYLMFDVIPGKGDVVLKLN